MIYRIAFGIAGAIVLVVGLIMLVTPGPAFVMIPIGLAMLSMEFAWAAAALDKALEKAQIAQEKAAQTSLRMRVLAGIAGVLGVAAVAVAVLHWHLGPF
jgi:uncharacterized protein (TIGR02611 family)